MTPALLGADVSLLGPNAKKKIAFENDYNATNKAGVIHFAKWIRANYTDKQTDIDRNVCLVARNILINVDVERKVCEPARGFYNS